MNGNMPLSMIKSRLEIIKHLQYTTNISAIRRATGHSRDLIRSVRDSWQNNDDLFQLNHKLGAPIKATTDICTEVASLTTANRRMPANQIANIISENNNVSISPSLVYSIKHQEGFKYLPPVNTFFTTETQRENRIKFCEYHLNNQTDFDNFLFTDESSFELSASHRWLWRRRGETSPDVQCSTSKFPKKIMIFGGISKQYCTPLIAIKGSINAESYVDDCIDGSGLIPSMNEIYGPFNWTLMQDGASPHTAQSTMDYLTAYCNVLENWPSGSPDLNPIENLWSIMKNKVYELNPQTEEQLIEIIFDVWENLDISLIHKLIDSMPSRLQKVIDNNGFPTKY